jgi:hypothetical protein
MNSTVISRYILNPDSDMEYRRSWNEREWMVTVPGYRFPTCCEECRGPGCRNCLPYIFVGCSPECTYIDCVNCEKFIKLRTEKLNNERLKI